MVMVTAMVSQGDTKQGEMVRGVAAEVTGEGEAHRDRLMVMNFDGDCNGEGGRHYRQSGKIW